MMAGTDKVLLVDGEVEFVEALAERLRAEGLDVEVATSGEECIEKAKNTLFQVIILDLASPGMDGIETLRVLREHNPDTQVVILTGQTTIKAAVAAHRLGVLDFIEKPTDITTLMEKIREAGANHLAATSPAEG
jgi:DNA-binding NtrC family response regulator